MVFNIAGVAIDSNFNRDTHQLAKAFEWDTETVKAISFKEAAQNGLPEGNLNVAFTNQGTLAFIDTNRAMQNFKLPNHRVVTFSYSATAMTFRLCVTEDGQIKREIMDIDGDALINDGRTLPEEVFNPHVSELIFDMIGKVTGRSFREFEVDYPCLHCTFK